MLTSGFLGSCWCGSWCLELKKLLYFPWIKCDLKLLKVSQCVTLHAIHLVRPSPPIIFISQLNLFHSWINLIVDLHTPPPPTPQCCCFKSSLKELINFTWFVVYILLLNLILLSAKHSGVCTWRVLNVSDPLKQGKNKRNASFWAELVVVKPNDHARQWRASEKIVKESISNTY